MVLAGGRAERLGGEDKAALEVGGATLLERALARGLPAPGGSSSSATSAPPPARSCGPASTRAYGGPVAATYAGLDALRAG